jgi:hypothetical protein
MRYIFFGVQTGQMDGPRTMKEVDGTGIPYRSTITMTRPLKGYYPCQFMAVPKFSK